MNRDTIALIINGVLAAGIVAAFIMGRLDLTTTIALLAASAAPSGGNALLSLLRPASPPTEAK